ncbi:NACHT domain-containing protein [Pedobacter metabolipauper]|uniref:NACHT domain-containing protein n=1 Tax=Pedobacter metabolipauper TaxID=425513 RepID=A0A4R6SZG9_9SPHI|nr:hypothetical protein [Pedobacter metabolipauper]TDQ10142.1 hypothetical protein ATK78_2307 [Pedobacter metabolipauper]
MDETTILNELKSLILSKTGIRTITPADCKRISIEISRTLNKNVSETTIKRLFGFAVVKHNFSKFTLTTLSEYVNDEYSGSEIFAGNSNKQHVIHSWKEIQEKATRITDFTLKGVKNRSGMPYELTISRKFAEHDFEDFFKSNYSFTSFISQPGYGRTIILGHLAERFLSNELPVYKNSTLLFITAYTLFNKEHVSVNLEDQLKEQLGIHSNDSLINHINKNYNASGGKFIIFMDGFSELVLKNDLKKQLFDSIIDFICTIEDSNSIKLVMSMRSTTWIRFYDCIRHSAFLKTKWFPGNYFNLNEVSNVPSLTEKEVDLIISKINRYDVQAINPKLKNQLKFPFHIQLYYQLKEEDPHFNYSTNITFYELISRFIQDKIYRSNYYTEKILFLKKVVQLTEYGKNGHAVSKDDLISELSAFKNAYTELLSDGILMEEKSHEEFHPREFVRFIHPHIFEYFLFIELLEKFHLKVDRSFFEYIRNEYDNNQARFQLLQWTIRFITRIGDFKSLTFLFDLDLNNYERNYLILFIAENLEYKSKFNPDTIKAIQEQGLHEAIIKQMMSFDFADSCFKDAVHVWIQITDSEAYLLVYQSLLLLFDVFSLDHKRIGKRSEILSQYSSNTWPADPYKISKAIYAKVMDVSSKNEFDLAHFEAMILNQGTEELTIEQSITYLLIIQLHFLSGDMEKTSKMIRLILNQHPSTFSRRTPHCIFFMNIYALVNSKINPGKNTDKMEKILVMLDRNKMKFRITKFSESILRLMQANQMKNKEEYMAAYDLALESLQLFKRNQLNLNCLMAYNLIIEIFTALNDPIRVNEYKYDRLCFIEDNNIPVNC